MFKESVKNTLEFINFIKELIREPIGLILFAIINISLLIFFGYKPVVTFTGICVGSLIITIVSYFLIEALIKILQK